VKVHPCSCAGAHGEECTCAGHCRGLPGICSCAAGREIERLRTELHEVKGKLAIQLNWHALYLREKRQSAQREHRP
jgi:hypothetical protein